MSSPVITFRHKEKVRNIVELLTSCRHHAFPVVMTNRDRAIFDHLLKIRRHKRPNIPGSVGVDLSPRLSEDVGSLEVRLSEADEEIQIEQQIEEGTMNGGTTAAHLVAGQSEGIISGATTSSYSQLADSGVIRIADVVENGADGSDHSISGDSSEGEDTIRLRRRVSSKDLQEMEVTVLPAGRRSVLSDEGYDYEEEKQTASFKVTTNEALNCFFFVGRLNGTTNNNSFFLKFNNIKGMILRSQLEILLRHPELFSNSELDMNKILDYHTMKEEDGAHKSPIPLGIQRFTVSEEDMDKYIDLSPYINTSAPTVSENWALGFTHTMFRYPPPQCTPPTQFKCCVCVVR